MAEQTGMYASTLHSALGLVTDEDSPLNDKELLSADLVVVDEFSMVDMRLAYILLDRIKSGAQLIIVGDADQLPSVGAGNVLREMIRSEKVPTAVLETVFRQASNSRIITNAYAINHNDTHLQFGDDFQFWKFRTRKRLRSWSSRTICRKSLCMVLRTCRFSHLSASEVRLRQMR